MNTNQILLENVNLYYSSVAYRERSIKSLVLKFAKKRSQLIQINDVHALKNINLCVQKGERVALLGRNGAGKSTLLKMLAGLYPISSGQQKIIGYVRSLFDLSLGFEAEATGRENIFYRGLLLGLKPAEVRQKMDEIIEFADIGSFIDYPIKTYSAGMQVRLAFAISTAVSGDILLLDEVIGAGDANFMAKAKKRILKLIEHAEILILASHDLASLNELCDRGVVMQEGRIVFDGPIKESIARYQDINSIATA